MKFRFHRGCFEESMATASEVFSLSELERLIERETGLAVKPGTVQFKKQIFDVRNGWDTYLVSASGRTGNNFPVGQSDGYLNYNSTIV